MRSDLHDIKVIYQTATERAVCVKQVEGGPDIWIPKSRCEVEAKDGHLRRGAVVTLTSDETTLTEKGLI